MYDSLFLEFPDGGSSSPIPISPVRETLFPFLVETAFKEGSRAKNFFGKIRNLCATLPENKEYLSKEDIVSILALAQKCRSVNAVSVALEIERKKKIQRVRQRPYCRTKGILSASEILARKRILRNEWKKRKRLTDIHFRIERTLRRRLHKVIKGHKKTTGTRNLLGCTSAFLKTYLEMAWKPGMSWENYGTFGWHIDHIRPCASFDLADPLEQAKCFHYKNLQPLWAKENIAKGAKYDPNQA